MNKKDLYSRPEYYDIAFCSYRDSAHEVGVIEESIRRYSRIPVKQILEMGCGPAPNLKDFVLRGYKYVGLDLLASMEKYVRSKYNSIEKKINFIVADMKDFSIPELVDFALIMGGSLMIKNTKDLLSHFNCVANSLKAGGLYLLDSCVEFDYIENIRNQWVIQDGEREFNAAVESFVVDRVNQLWKHQLSVEISEKKKKSYYESYNIMRVLFPQEFLLILENVQLFEFVGWWNNWNLEEPVEEAKKIERPLILLRRI